MNTNTAKKKPLDAELPSQEREKVVNLESFQSDVICTKCGHWKTEHDWDSCGSPNWIGDTD